MKPETSITPYKFMMIHKEEYEWENLEFSCQDFIRDLDNLILHAGGLLKDVDLTSLNLNNYSNDMKDLLRRYGYRFNYTDIQSSYKRGTRFYYIDDDTYDDTEVAEEYILNIYNGKARLVCLKTGMVWDDSIKINDNVSCITSEEYIKLVGEDFIHNFIVKKDE